MCMSHRLEWRMPRLRSVVRVKRAAYRRASAAAAIAMALAFLSQRGFPDPDFGAAQTACSDTNVCANGVFCSGFEEGNKSIWDDYDGNPDSTNILMSDPGPCNTASNHVMRLLVPAG